MAVENLVLVAEGGTDNAFQAHHSAIPELHAHGETPESAAVNLEQAMTRQVEDTVDQCRRETIERALSDVREFIKPRP